MAPMARRRDVLTSGAIAALVVAADQATKVWARGSLWPDHEVTVISGWLWFRLTSNSGASLGLLRGHNLVFLVASILVVVAVAVVVIRGALVFVLTLLFGRSWRSRRNAASRPAG